VTEKTYLSLDQDDWAMAGYSRPRYLIFGTGALGSVFGGLMHLREADVTFIGRGRHFDETLKNGLRITGIWGDHFIPPEEIKGFTDQSDIDEKFNVILLCVKSTDTSSAAAKAAPLLDDNGIMVSMQNGLGNWDKISAHVGDRRTVGGRVIFGAEIPESGTVKVTVCADKVLIGEVFVLTNNPLLKDLEKDLNAACIPTSLVSRDEIHSATWEKVIINSALNSIGAILEVTYGKLRDNPETREAIRHVIIEAFAVMEAIAVKPPLRTTDDFYDLLMKRLISATDHHPSMLQDIMKGRVTEIDTLNGAISKYGKEAGVPTPYNDLLTALVKFKEKPENRHHGDLC
jgi:2-dehydropantoate 2-reductase